MDQKTDRLHWHNYFTEEVELNIQSSWSREKFKPCLDVFGMRHGMRALCYRMFK
jgi:hypothetical protein